MKYFMHNDQTRDTEITIVFDSLINHIGYCLNIDCLNASKLILIAKLTVCLLHSSSNRQLTQQRSVITPNSFARVAEDVIQHFARQVSAL